jgi:predicted CoA-binding protein
MNPVLKSAIDEFLSQKVIVIVGDTWGKEDPALHILARLQGQGFEVFRVAKERGRLGDVEVYGSILEIPVDVGAVLVTGSAELAARIVGDCAQRGIRWVWLHSALGTSPRRWMHKMEHAISSVGPEALVLARQHGITVIPGACPMMFCADADFPHRMVRGVLEWLGCLEERTFPA